MSEHDFKYSFEWIDKTKHFSKCICGEYTIESHVVSSGSDRCLFCHGLADRGLIKFNVPLNVLSIDVTFLHLQEEIDLVLSMQLNT